LVVENLLLVIGRPWPKCPPGPGFLQEKRREWIRRGLAGTTCGINIFAEKNERKGRDRL